MHEVVFRIKMIRAVQISIFKILLEIHFLPILSLCKIKFFPLPKNFAMKYSVCFLFSECCLECMQASGCSEAGGRLWRTSLMGTFASGLDILALQCPPVEVGKQGGQAGFLQECRRFLGYLQSAFPVNYVRGRIFNLYIYYRQTYSRKRIWNILMTRKKLV